jgi:hypothetical protein
MIAAMEDVDVLVIPSDESARAPFWCATRRDASAVLHVIMDAPDPRIVGLGEALDALVVREVALPVNNLLFDFFVAPDFFGRARWEARYSWRIATNLPAERARCVVDLLVAEAFGEFFRFGGRMFPALNRPT